MDLKQYKELALQTENTNFNEILGRLQDGSMIRALHGLITMQTEMGELIDAFKKHIFYGKELDIVNIQEEIGDKMWGVVLFCDAVNINLEDCMKKNIDKLKARYPNKFTNENAINRNIDNERKILESNE